MIEIKQDEYIIEEGYIKNLLTNFSKTTGMYVSAVDTKGKSLIDIKVDMCEFCKSLQINDKRIQKCEKSYAKANKEAIKWKEPYFFRCHAGLFMWAMPLIINNKNIGSVICGQVLLMKPNEYVLKEIRKYNTDVEEYDLIEKHIFDMKVMQAKTCQAAADMLYLALNSIIQSNKEIEEENTSRFWIKKIRSEIEDRKKHKDKESVSYDSYIRKERNLLQYLRMGDEVKTREKLASIFSQMYLLSKGNVDEVKMRCSEFATLSSRSLIEGGLDSYLSLQNLEEFKDTIGNIDEAEEVFAKLSENLLKQLDYILVLSDDKHISMLKQARRFILDNYDKDIRIEDIANEVMISSSRLSHLFREKLNYTVVDYITRVRVEKSIELMRKRELSIADISALVGFNSTSHFSKVFKKHIGITPLTYRNKFL